MVATRKEINKALAQAFRMRGVKARAASHDEAAARRWSMAKARVAEGMDPEAAVESVVRDEEANA